MKISRRQFLFTAAASLGAAGIAAAAGKNDVDKLHEARYYKKLPQRKIECELCPRRCVIDDMERGYCGVRENHGGVYYSLVYGQVCSANIDPIEKKPLFHFLPGAKAFSIATVGCNVMCKFCQNWEISQANVDQVKSMELLPAQTAAIAKDRRCEVIAYTYTEPVVFTEYMYDCAVEGRKAGVRSVMISNGYINAQPMKDLCNVLDAVKIDLKAFNERFYRELVAGELKPVLDTLVLLKKQKMWTEIVYLVIPGQNDDPGELREMCTWIKNDLGPETPVHFSRFHPQYRLTNIPATPLEVLRKARRIGLECGLYYVYTGNVPGDEGESTYCPNCGAVVIKRFGFSVLSRALKDGRCVACGRAIAGVWS
ncbi:MAG: AmmeMemoRadiSam system radical SAM enzyme [candidate division KSB1 bacterium]|nr:AmmeMemoRadiSam system radical SAM enzyme [candidate division KSB1 bacterium]MDZ7345687.1 AmmeMemoRadiSam system radical SAM enzyme [candidate division KSB1 bacterium]